MDYTKSELVEKGYLDKSLENGKVMVAKSDGRIMGLLIDDCFYLPAHYTLLGEVRFAVHEA